MKKNKLVSLLIFCFLFPFSLYASDQISQIELDIQTKAGNILSDWYTSLSECSTLKNKYNQEYNNYKRSECFLNGTLYNYFICSFSSHCIVNLSWTSSQTIAMNVPYQEKLDAFLTKLIAMRKELNNDIKYKTILLQIKTQLQTLSSKYKSNTMILQMLVYLNKRVDEIQDEFISGEDIDDFFCDLLWTCWLGDDSQNSSSSSSSSWGASTSSSSSSSSGWNSSSSSSSGWATQPVVFEHKSVITGEIKDSYYIDEKIDLYSKPLWKNVIWCLEIVWVSSTSCNISSNWIPLPNPRYYAGDGWKHDNLILWRAWTFIWYHKDLDTGKEAKFQFIILNQKRPEYIKTANVIYKWTKKLDVFLPTNVWASKKIPVYLMIHGWWWTAGDKWDTDTTIVNFWWNFVKNGVAYVPMSYTLANSSVASHTEVYKEIDCALKWISYHKDTYNFDVNNINLIWWSAWGHLALQYALNQSNYNDTQCQWWNGQTYLRQVASVAAPTDLSKDFSQTTAGNLNPRIEYFLGAQKGTALFNQRVLENSPIYFINKDNKNIKYYLFHASNDGVVNYGNHGVPFYNFMKDNNYSVILNTSFNDHDALSIPESSIQSMFHQ